MNNDGLAGLAIAIFLIVVVWNGRADKLFALLQRDRAFAKWAVAILFVLWIKSATPAPEDEIFGAVLGVTFLALALTSGPNILKSAEQFSGLFNG